MGTPEVVIIIPVLRRPHRVRPLLENIAVATPEGSYRVLFVASPYDVTEIAAIVKHGGEFVTVGWDGGSPGDYARKVNAGYRASTEPLIFTGADDLNFHPGWLEAAKAKLKPGIGMVGTNDLGNPRVKQGRHSTHSLFRREYADIGTVDEPHKIYHEGYAHQFCDDEAVQTAMARRAFAFARNSIVQHDHPHWNKGEMDEVYAIGDRSLAASRQLYMQRRHLWRGRNLPRFKG